MSTAGAGVSPQTTRSEWQEKEKQWRSERAKSSAAAVAAAARERAVQLPGWLDCVIPFAVIGTNRVAGDLLRAIHRFCQVSPDQWCEMTDSDLARHCASTTDTAHKCLAWLANAGLIEAQKDGRIKRYRLILERLRAVYDTQYETLLNSRPIYSKKISDNRGETEA